MPSGAVVESRKVTLTVADATTGIIKTQVLQEQNPQTACCGKAKDLNDITECGKCQALICETHSLVCPLCGIVCCLTCSKETEVEDKKIRICVDCAKRIKSPLISTLKKLLWG